MYIILLIYIFIKINNYSRQTNNKNGHNLLNAYYIYSINNKIANTYSKYNNHFFFLFSPLSYIILSSFLALIINILLK